AVDPVTRVAHAQLYKSLTSKSAREFLAELIAALPFPLRSVQVDNGSEFKGAFEAACAELGVPLYTIPPRTPKANAKVERLHRTFRDEHYAFEPPHPHHRRATGGPEGVPPPLQPPPTPQGPRLPDPSRVRSPAEPPVSNDLNPYSRLTRTRRPEYTGERWPRGRLAPRESTRFTRAGSQVRTPPRPPSRPPTPDQVGARGRGGGFPVRGLSALRFLVDPLTLAIGPFAYGGDALGIAAGLQVPVLLVQAVALVVFLVDREVVAQRLLPAYSIETK